MNKQILVTQSSMPDIEEFVSEIESLWETKWLTNMGAKHKEFQRKLVEYLDIDNIDLFTNGHMSIELGLKALNLPKGSEVITTPFTFISTTSAIVRNDLIPVFCDINPNDFTMDVTQIESLITDKTSAILPVHVYGNVCDVEKIQEIADRHGLKVLYDAAHAFGVKYKGTGIGSFGDISCFSFHATKVFHSIEGGAACFHNQEIGNRLELLKNFGMTGPENIECVGLNAKMNEFCAAMGLCNLRHIDNEIAKRALVVERYRTQLETIEGIQLAPQQKDVQQNHAYFPVVFDENKFGASRNDVYEALAANHIIARKYFYPLTNSIDMYENKYTVLDTPNALYVSQNVLALPLYANLALDDIDRICAIILSCKR